MFEPSFKLDVPLSRFPAQGQCSPATHQKGRRPFKMMGMAATVAVMLALSACNGQSESPSTNADGPLKIGVQSVPTTFDPGQNFLATDYAIMNLVGGTLTDVSTDGKSVTMGLAEALTPGDKQYVVKLKPDLKFSDGTPLTATDVAATFEYYMADKSNGYDYTFAAIQKVTAVDDLTVTFDLKQPYPALDMALAYPSSAIIPAKSIQEKGKDLYKGDPLPTAGKFQIQSFDANYITLTANPNYAGAKPSTTSLTFNKITDSAARLAQVQGGQIDFAEDISPKQIPQLSGPVQARTTKSVNGMQFLGMNNRDNSLLSDVRIRKAVSAAINRDQINDVAMAGKSTVALGLFANSSKNSRPLLQEKPDLEGAKDLLSGTKCSNGCTLRFIADSSDEVGGDIAVVAQQNLREIGIQVNIERSEAAVVIQQANEGNYDFRSTYFYDSLDNPGPYLSYLLGPTIKALRTGYSNPEMNQLIDTVQTSSGSEAASAMDQINELFEKDLPMIPITDYMVVSASRVPEERLSLSPTLFYNVG